jgi:hypothetical protein
LGNAAGYGAGTVFTRFIGFPTYLTVGVFPSCNITTDSESSTIIMILKELEKFRKLILFLDRTSQHCHSKRLKAYLEKIMTSSSELEECWRQGM